MLTSGSTGKPREVALKHEARCSHVFADGNALSLDKHARTSYFATLALDASDTEILTTDHWLSRGPAW